MTVRRRFLSGLAASAALMLLISAPPAVAKETPDRYDDVVAVRVLPNGNTEVTMYSPAPGVTSRQLHNSLQRAGVTGLLSPDAPPAGTFDVFSCYYGTAYALENGRCPALNWRKNGRVRPQVHFNDHTSADWPVNASAKKWNESVVLDVTYGTGWCAGYGAHCVHTYNGNYGDTDWTGRTWWQYDNQRAFIDEQFTSDSTTTTPQAPTDTAKRPAMSWATRSGSDTTHRRRAACIPPITTTPLPGWRRLRPAAIRCIPHVAQG